MKKLFLTCLLVIASASFNKLFADDGSIETRITNKCGITFVFEGTMSKEDAEKILKELNTLCEDDEDHDQPTP